MAETQTQTLVPHEAPVAPYGIAGAGGLLALVAIAALFVAPKRPPAAGRLEAPRPVAPGAAEQLPEHAATPPTAPGRRPSLEPTPRAATQTPVVAPPAFAEAPTVGLVGRLRAALGKSREALQQRFDSLFGGATVDEGTFDELEEALLMADVGVQTATRLTDRVRERAAAVDNDPAALRAELRAAIRDTLAAVDPAMCAQPASGPLVLLVVGVNGSGKTTTIGKLAARYKAEGRSVLLAAADTYRAAASEQLAAWSERAGVELVRHDEGADPGAVVYDALDTAIARGRDVVIVDTAGRLQTMRPLMEQLAKLRRVIGKKVDGGPHETLLVLDGTMGQNGLSQARQFNEATPLSGVIVTKLDGTAKGGMILTIAAEMELPIKFIGIGEGVDDLRPFEVDPFVEALA